MKYLGIPANPYFTAVDIGIRYIYIKRSEAFKMCCLSEDVNTVLIKPNHGLFNCGKMTVIND